MARHFLHVLLFVLPLVAFLVGLSWIPIWSCAVLPLIEVIVWVVAWLNASARDDMKHAYLWIGMIFAIACSFFWLGGRAIRVSVGSASRE
jgi:hypothetical protein